ncbi:MAG: hypothetical protein WC712_10730 [Candidatus Brocadiia bacterium]
MSTVSKILVVVILAFSFALSGISIALFAQRANWKALYAGVTDRAKTEKVALDDQIKELQKQKGDVQNELATIKADRDNLAAETSRLKQDIADKENEKQRLETLSKQKEDSLNSMNDKVDNLVKEIDSLNEKMRRDAQDLLETKRNYERVVNQLTTLRDKANSLMLQLKNTQRDLEQAKTDNEGLTLALRKYAEVTKENIPDVKSKVTMRGRVIGVNNEAGIVMLSVGKDDKVARGMEFIVHRGEQYICKIRIESTYPDSCVARVIPETLNTPDAKVEIGDNAFTN